MINLNVLLAELARLEVDEKAIGEQGMRADKFGKRIEIRDNNTRIEIANIEQTVINLRKLKPIEFEDEFSLDPVWDAIV